MSDEEFLAYLQKEADRLAVDQKAAIKQRKQEILAYHEQKTRCEEAEKGFDKLVEDGCKKLYVPEIILKGQRAKMTGGPRVDLSEDQGIALGGIDEAETKLKAEIEKLAEKHYNVVHARSHVTLLTTRLRAWEECIAAAQQQQQQQGQKREREEPTPQETENKSKK